WRSIPKYGSNAVIWWFETHRPMHYSLRYALTGMLFLAIVAAVPPRKKPKFIDPANLDKSIKPGDNFYLYANGGWLKNNPIPPSKTSWSSFGTLREESSRRLK